jgi:GNAT superfamily N-acetyltransferase
MRLYIVPTHQGRGGGRRLLDAACSRLRELGFESVTLWTAEEEWNAAHGFYVRLGWLLEDAHQTDDDIPDRLPLP